ncbi:MAG: SH3 domain-containing protein [Phascolarctobacterium sp.]|nr:SH3 domain-containing protein [Phascolarctobacterium sp.]
MKSFFKTDANIIIMAILICVVTFLSFGCRDFKYKKYLDAITADKQIKVEGNVGKIDVKEYYPRIPTVVCMKNVIDNKETGKVFLYYSSFMDNKILGYDIYGRNVDYVSYVYNESKDIFVKKTKNYFNPLQQALTGKTSMDTFRVSIFQIGEKEIDGKKYTVLPYYFTISTDAGIMEKCIALVEEKKDECSVEFYAPNLGEIEYGSIKDNKYKWNFTLVKYGSPMTRDLQCLRVDLIEDCIVPFKNKEVEVNNGANIKKDEVPIKNEAKVKNIENKKCYITGNNVFKRSAPSTSASDYGFFKHNELVTVLERMNAEGREWARVRLSSGQECYVAAHYLSEKSPVQQTAIEKQSAGTGEIYVGSSGRFDLVMLTKTLRNDEFGARAIDVKLRPWGGGQEGKMVFRFKHDSKTDKWLVRQKVDADYSPVDLGEHISSRILDYVSKH